MSIERIPPRVIAGYRAYMEHAREQEHEVRRDLPPRKTFSIFIAGNNKAPRRDRNRPGPIHGGGPRE